jgi:hypothetical protein
MNYDTKQISIALEELHNSKDVSDAAYSTLKYAIEQLILSGVSNSIPAVRVRWHPTDTDETFVGTVIDEKLNYYVVIPDQNLTLNQNWNKKLCDVLR